MIGNWMEHQFKGLADINWGILLLCGLVALVGVAMLYSVGGGSWSPWAGPHLVRFVLCLIMALVVALLPLQFWMQWSYVLYGVALLLLIGVEVAGETAMGATRWLELGPVRIQPSEFMKIAVILGLARYYHQITSEKANKPLGLIIPALMMALPVGLVMHQPDLGTALLIAFAAFVIIFLAGLGWMWIAGTFTTAIVGGVLAFFFVLHDYQRSRILVFLDPTSDPRGASYHVLQSKTAIGSGGLTGQGWMQGAQSQLDFLPEAHTDFVFSAIGEEFGFVGSAFVLTLFAALIGALISVALRCRHNFGRFVAAGIAANISMYVMVNAAMVMGLAPVVGIPMPMISNGGTVMLSVMFGIGLALCVDRDRNRPLTKLAGLF